MKTNGNNVTKPLFFTCGLAAALITAYTVSQMSSGTGKRDSVPDRLVAINTETQVGIDAETLASESATETSVVTSSVQATRTMPITLTDSNFVEQVLKSSKPVLVDAWAAWCIPCRAMAPAIDDLAEVFGRDAIVGKLNVDENPQVARALQIESLPTLLIFKDGRIVDQIVGMASKEKISQRLLAVVDADAA